MTSALNTNNFTFEVDINVINHLGVGLYSSTPAALTELVANAWDAEAKNVWIDIQADKDTITIEDDGHGMDANAIKQKFLHVGYSRRVASNNNLSATGKRKVMGRKGIGKLSMFALSDFVKVTSKTSTGAIVGFEVDVPLLKKNLEQHTKIVLNEFAPTPLKNGQGTRIELTSVLKTLNKTEKYLRVKLARRFSVLGKEFDFRVFLNGSEITDADRDIYDSVQFLWAFDQATLDRIKPLCKNLSSVTDDDGNTSICTKLLPDNVSFPDGSSSTVTGYIASVFQPRNLGSKEDSANALSIFANGRVFAENILGEANSAKYYQNYLVGELHANFLDEDDTDRATASREAIKRDDPKYRALLGFALSSLEGIGDQWDEWRTSLGLDPTISGNAAVNEWLETLKDRRDLRTAKRLMTSIQNATVHSDEAKNNAAKAVLYRGAIIGFEKLRIKQQLDRLSNISDVLGPEFAAIFSTLSDVEEAAYADITKQRLEIIRKFQAIKDSPTDLEKVAQKYLFDHLWLLDPSWDRVTGRKEMELTLTEYIKKINPDSSGARLDISYRSSSGRHVVVELKKPSLTALNYDILSSQARKYRQAVEKYYQDNFPGKTAPALDIYLLVAKTPTGMDERDVRSLAEQNTKFITYQQLITDATNAYQSYLDVNTDIGPLETILSKI
ncbi:ATP-binding protein [Agrobacterium sp. Ap1]|uniref:BbrUII/HgiDII family restriction enzyme n=1 Tax=Agrobacterium sp. Ap1 TaxID=2815337 RepID=UPI001A908804|nr:ATP-binding protein [Agrobacterium sp. Ap1]MBO0145424.1 ATP-binding protein [Agrobacterium sp. Ap1]